MTDAGYGTDAGTDVVHRVATALRVPAFAVAAAGLALLAHLLAGGALPAGTALLLAGALTLAQGLALSVRERGGPLIGAHVLGAQAVLHVLFEPGASHASLPSPHGWHSVSGAAGSVGWPSGWMLAAHVAAAVLVAVWLRRGEAALWRCVRRVLVPVPDTSHTVPVAAPVRLTPLRSPTAAPRPGVHHRPAPRRGPPVTV